MRVAFPRSHEIAFTFYIIREGDRADLLAQRFLGKPSLWWILARANPEILDWFDLKVGTIIRIPNG